MELKEKTVAFLGDSITSGFGLSSNEECYLEIIKKEYGLKKALNFGFPGSRIARQTEATLESLNDDLYFRLRAMVMPSDIDIICVFGGINDYLTGDAVIGMPSSTDDFTFYGALNNLITMLKSRYYNSKIVLITPIHSLNDYDLNKNANSLSDYADAIKLCASMHNVYLIDCYNNLALSPKDKKCLPDGVHPNALGHQILAAYIGSMLKKL